MQRLGLIGTDPGADPVTGSEPDPGGSKIPSLEEAGLPPGLLSVLPTASPAPVGEALTDEDKAGRDYLAPK